MRVTNAFTEVKSVFPSVEHWLKITQLRSSKPELPSQNKQLAGREGRLSYSSLRQYLLLSHQEELLNDVADQVSEIRRRGLNVWAITEYDGFMIAVTQRLGSCFVTRTDDKEWDIWLDFSQIHQISKTLQLPVWEVTEVALLHESGHVLMGYLGLITQNCDLFTDEELAWSGAKLLHQQIGGSKISTIELVYNHLT